MFSIKTQKEIASSIESQKVTLFMDLKIQQGQFWWRRPVGFAEGGKNTTGN